jgi:hypothetical protein
LANGFVQPCTSAEVIELVDTKIRITTSLIAVEKSQLAMDLKER